MMGNQLMKTPEMQQYGGAPMPPSSHGGMSPFGVSSGHPSMSVNSALQQQASMGMLQPSQPVSLNQSPMAAMHHLASLNMSMGHMPMGQPSLNGGQGDYTQFAAAHLGAPAELGAALMNQGDFGFHHLQQRHDFPVLDRMQLDMFDKPEE